jgi:predicted short-subunit dehydrogenase-like oxidoreductase (DUF2520 family)
MAKAPSMNLAFFGAGKVGVALARAAKASGAKKITLRPARSGLPRRAFDADLLVLCVRDRDLGPLAERLAGAGLVAPHTACVHVAGALGADALAPLRGVSAGVAQMHPMISFADKKKPPLLAGGHVHVKGDPVAEKRARAFARAIGMVPRTFPSLDPVGYHAAAAFVANGAAVLAALGARILAVSGVPEDVAPAMLAPLLHSVADNVAAVRFPGCLTGPVRRGDAAAIERHYRVLADRLAEALPLYVDSAAAQAPLARAIGDAPAESFDALERTVAALRLEVRAMTSNAVS